MSGAAGQGPGAIARTGRWPIVLVFLVVLALADQNGWLLIKHVDDVSEFHGQSAKVWRALSGDLIEVDLHDPLHGTLRTQVRLWGISAPQPPRPGREAEAMWSDALEHAELLVVGHEVVLRLESHRTRDPQGVLLAHVELPSGGTLNEMMLRAGLAQRDERWPHRMLTPYAQAENIARRKSEGIWKEH